MNSNRPWLFDEMHQAGADHAVRERAMAYDLKMGMFRDYAREADLLAEKLSIQKEHTVIDFGTGTGALSLNIAGKCKTLFAVDVSREILKIAEEKAALAHIDNIVFSHSGFLTYEHPDDPVDFIITNAALHHLPDFWKAVALKRMHSFLKTDGILYLSDVTYSFAIGEYETEIQNFINDIRQKTDAEFAQDAFLHIKEEFSTFDWIMDEILKQTRFEILEKQISSKTFTQYTCRKMLDK